MLLKKQIHTPTPDQILAYVSSRDVWIGIAEIRRDLMMGKVDGGAGLAAVVKKLVGEGRLEARERPRYEVRAGEQAKGNIT